MRSLHARLRVIGVSLLCCHAARVASAQAPAGAQPSPQRLSAAAPALTAEDVESFLDGMMPLQLQQHDIAGTVISVVKDGKLLFAKGYGYSDVKLRTPVTTDATLFRIGSVSKTFTWTAVMQLVEQGKIDLDRDVNAYIDFKIPAPYGKPVTMRNLLTHTPGFEENVKDMFKSDARDLRPLGEHLKTHVPAQIFAPGTTPAYSNYGATLAAYVVQRVSGTPFNEYIRLNVFQPLGMTRATFDQPLPNDLKAMMSQGYGQASQPPKSFEVVQVWPAGSMSVTADAMSHFMIAHLEDGQYGGMRILKPETAHLMHSRQFGVSPALNAMAFGFYQEARNGHRIVGHAGDTQWFHSDLHLMLDEHIGFFISSNSAGKDGDLRTAVWEGFLDRYFPYAPPAAPPLASALNDARFVAGPYQSSRRMQTNAFSVVGLLSQERVSVNADSTISNDSRRDMAGNPRHFREIAPLVFREVNDQSLIAFTKDENGNLVMGGDFPFEVGQPTPLLKNGRLNLGTLFFVLGVFLATLLSWPAAAVLRKHYGATLSLSARSRRLRWLMRITSVASLLFLGLKAAFLASIQSNISALSSSADGYSHFLQMIGLLGVLGLPIAVVYSVGSWRESSLWFWTKAWNSLLLLAFAAYTGFLLNWHLLQI